MFVTSPGNPCFCCHCVAWLAFFCFLSPLLCGAGAHLFADTQVRNQLAVVRSSEYTLIKSRFDELLSRQQKVCS